MKYSVYATKDACLTTLLVGRARTFLGGRFKARLWEWKNGPAGRAWVVKTAACVVDATDVECPTCNAWVGWACAGDDFGYHAAGYHPARYEAAGQAAVLPRDVRDRSARTDTTTRPTSQLRVKPRADARSPKKEDDR